MNEHLKVPDRLCAWKEHWVKVWKVDLGQRNQFGDYYVSSLSA